MANGRDTEPSGRRGAWGEGKASRGRAQGGRTAFLRNGVFGDAHLPGQEAKWVCPRCVTGHVEHLLLCPPFPGLHSALSTQEDGTRFQMLQLYL